MKNKTTAINDEMIQQLQKKNAALADIAAELYHFSLTLNRVMYKLEAQDAQRLYHAYRYMEQKLVLALDQAGLTLIDLTDQPYEMGMAVQALNIEEFNDEELVVDQMIEPIIMANKKIMRTGVVTVKRKEESK